MTDHDPAPSGGPHPEAMTPKVAARLLAAHGLAPRKSAGQNFVVDPNTVDRIVDDSGVGADDDVLEIGPGLCSLTLPLAARARSVIAIEIDAGLAKVARSLAGAAGNVEVLHADAMQVDLDATVPAGTRLVANLPYNVATPLLMHVLSSDHVHDAYVMVQREVGERWAAVPGDSSYGAVSVKVALAGVATLERTIARAVFLPVPNVDSVMVRVVRHPDAPSADERARIAAVVDAAFAQRRKTLRNNLRRAFGDDGEGALAAAGIDPGARAETLDVAAFVRLADALGHG